MLGASRPSPWPESLLYQKACVAAADVGLEWSQTLHRREESPTGGVGASLGELDGQVDNVSGLEMTNEGMWAQDPEGGLPREAPRSRLRPAQPPRPRPGPGSGAVSAGTCVHTGLGPEQSPRVGTVAQSQAARHLRLQVPGDWLSAACTAAPLYVAALSLGTAGTRPTTGLTRGLGGAHPPLHPELSWWPWGR